MKKTIIYIITAVVTFLIVIGVMFLVERAKVKKMINNFDKAFESKELEIIFYASSQCGYCELEKPILNQIADDYDLEYVNIDAALLTQSQKDKMTKKLGIEGATPTTAVVKDGKVISKQVGYLDGYDYVNFFIEAGVLKEGSKYKPEDKLNFIGLTEFNELENGILVLGQTASTDCTDLRKTLNNISKEYKVTFNYFNLRKLTRDEYYETIDKLRLMNVKKYDLMKEDNVYTPQILVVENGEIVKVIKEKEEDKIISALSLKK